MRARLLALALVTTACGDATDRPVEPQQAAPVELTAQVNVQMDDTPAGLQPIYLVTAQVRALQDSVRVPARLDSIVVYHRRGAGAWTRTQLLFGVPAEGVLPFAAVSGEEYGVWAVLYARGFGAADTIAGRDEFTVTRRGYVP